MDILSGLKKMFSHTPATAVSAPVPVVFYRVTTTITPSTKRANGWSWVDSPALMARLSKAQTELTCAGVPVDIETIVGFFTSEAQLIDHLARYENKANEFAPRSER